MRYENSDGEELETVIRIDDEGFVWLMDMFNNVFINTNEKIPFKFDDYKTGSLKVVKIE